MDNGENIKLSAVEVHKEIDLVQSCINRMSNNSFIVKGWMITLVAAFIALLSNKVDLYIICILISIIILCFWYLDAFFLKTEKLYRMKYEWIIKVRREGNIDFLYDLNPYNKLMWLPNTSDLHNVFRIMVSKTLIPFYGLPFISAITTVILKCFKII